MHDLLWLYCLPVDYVTNSDVFNGTETAETALTYSYKTSTSFQDVTSGSTVAAIASTNTEPPEKQVTFPLKFSFVNTSDPDPTRIDVRFGAHWPKEDSTTYVLTGVGGAAVGQLIDHTMERIGYPRVRNVHDGGLIDCLVKSGCGSGLGI